jgi:hypothetical protein
VPPFDSESRTPRAGGKTPPSPIAVHLERAYDPETKTWRLDAWATVDSSAITSGFLARISDYEWKALCLDALEAAQTAYQALASGLGKPATAPKHP